MQVSVFPPLEWPRTIATTDPLATNALNHRYRGASILRNPISNPRRNLVAFLSPRLKVGGRKFGELAALELLAVSERRSLFSEPCIVPLSTVVLFLPHANIVGPPGRLHEQHEATIRDGNVLKPRLPLVRVPGMSF